MTGQSPAEAAEYPPYQELPLSHNDPFATGCTMPTILFADDCANICEFLKQELEEEGYRVLLARDGKEAIDMAQSDRPDLAILDIWMPRVGGLEVAERIAAIDPNIRVILFTNNDELCLRDPRSAFAVACIEKGNDFAELKRTIVSVFASRKDNGLVGLGLPPPQGRPLAGPHRQMPRAVTRDSANR